MSSFPVLEAPVSAIGWAFIRSLCQKRTLHTLLIVTLRLVPPQGSDIRCALALSALALLSVAPAVSTYYPVASPAVSAGEVVSAEPLPSLGTTQVHFSEVHAQSLSTPRILTSTTWALQEQVSTAMPRLVMARLFGIIVFDLRLAGGCVLANQMCRESALPIPPWPTLVARNLYSRIRIDLVLTKVGNKAETPIVVWRLRLAILFPTSGASGTGLARLKFILAHEIAPTCREIC